MIFSITFFRKVLDFLLFGAADLAEMLDQFPPRKSVNNNLLSDNVLVIFRLNNGEIRTRTRFLLFSLLGVPRGAAGGSRLELMDVCI